VPELLEQERLSMALETPLRLKKFILPFDEAQAALRLLEMYDITKAHLMPTLDNVAEQLRRRDWSANGAS